MRKRVLTNPGVERGRTLIKKKSHARNERRRRPGAHQILLRRHSPIEHTKKKKKEHGPFKKEKVKSSIERSGRRHRACLLYKIDKDAKKKPSVAHEGVPNGKGSGDPKRSPRGCRLLNPDPRL